MNIQIFGSPKSFDSKKAERWFKERRIKYQYIDLKSRGLSPREDQAVRRCVNGVGVGDLQPRPVGGVGNGPALGHRSPGTHTLEQQLRTAAGAGHGHRRSENA